MKDKEMFVAFIAAVVLMVGSANMGFQQGQANPDAQSFFESQSQ
jgi:hypothetical protein